jgi:hypothetical protein
MPPRYAYWTILIDQKPTAFRAKEKEELLPTFVQLQRKNPDVVMKWFARGRLWDNPEQAQWALENMDRTPFNRGRDWRPGGEHKDPRDRFKKRREARSPGAPSGFRKPPSSDRPAPRSGDRPAPVARRPAPKSGDRPAPGSGDRPASRKWPKKDRG